MSITSTEVEQIESAKTCLLEMDAKIEEYKTKIQKNPLEVGEDELRLAFAKDIQIDEQIFKKQVVFFPAKAQEVNGLTENLEQTLMKAWQVST